METNVSDSLLYIYEYREAYGRLYGIIFVAILIIFGLTVNAVFLVTYFHIRSTVRSGNIVYYELLLYLALLDLLTCAGVMPVDALQQRYMFTLYSDSGCRIQQFLKCVLTTSSGMMTLVIAVHRYRKICAPLGRQMSFRVARLVFGGIVLGSMMLHIPVAIVTGPETFTRYNISDLRICGIRDDVKDSIGIKAIFFVWISVFCLLTVFTVCLYGVIAWRVHRKHTRGPYSPSILMHSPTFVYSSTTTANTQRVNVKSYDTETRKGIGSMDKVSRDVVLDDTLFNIVTDNKRSGKSVALMNGTQSLSDKTETSERPDLKVPQRPKLESQGDLLVLDRAATLRPRSEQLLPSLQVNTSMTRRAFSFGNINDLNIVTKTALRTKHCGQRKQINDDVKRIGAVISVTYVLSVIPFSAALPLVLSGAWSDNTVLDVFVHLGVRSLYFRSALNPLLYGAFDRKLRKWYITVYEKVKETFR